MIKLAEHAEDSVSSPVLSQRGKERGEEGEEEGRGVGEAGRNLKQSSKKRNFHQHFFKEVN